MPGKIKPGKRFGHVAVRLNHHILVIGGKWENYVPKFQREIWMYNLYIDRWQKYDLPQHEAAPPALDSACAVAVGAHAFMFGGIDESERKETIGFSKVLFYTNDLWKLSKSADRCFVWSKIKARCASEEPSPRAFHAAWEYRGHLYIFGGAGPSLDDYLNEHGDFNEVGDYEWGFNNQLHCFNPSNETWESLVCSGSVPKPWAGHATTKIKESVWILGGRDFTSHYPEMFELNLYSLIWTEIHSIHTDQLARSYSMLTAISDSQLLLHGGLNEDRDALSDTWIFEITSQTWSKYTANKDHPRHHHTITGGINRGNCVIVGGSYASISVDVEKIIGYRTISHMLLEPISLQQLACRVIYKHKRKLPWDDLPPSLISLLEMDRNEKGTLGVIECQRKCIS